MAKDSMEARLRRATEAILEAENLTDGLQDAEAEALLNWGLARVEGAAQATASLDKAAAKAQIDGGVALVRQIMRRVNNLVAGRVDIEEDEELADGLRALVQAAPHLPKMSDEMGSRDRGRPAQDTLDVDAAIGEVAEQRFRLSDAQMLRKVLALIDTAAETDP
jgi:hypothetical protein